jgi:hypothetical protein
MNVWQKILIPTLIAVLIGGGYVFFVFQSRRDSGAAASKAAAAQPLSKDDLAVVMQNFYASFDAAKEMEGKPVWIKAGYSLPYYPYAGKPGTGPGSGTVEFAKRVGELPAAEKLQVLKLVKAVAPAKEDNLARPRATLLRPSGMRRAATRCSCATNSSTTTIHARYTIIGRQASGMP